MGSWVEARKACSKRCASPSLLKPISNPTPLPGLGNRLERDWLDFGVIQPGPDLVHGVAEGSWLPFHANGQGGIERHIALLPLALRREHIVGASSRAGLTNKIRYRTFRRWR